ncbi:hypothetical protein [Cryptosporangium sp. NPDC048952]|uniref:hypothetical protein n=1 Tax=Cryptosporangium sp. NPDC048952 TaxID=3363961 RepID=UPI003722523E
MSQQSTSSNSQILRPLLWVLLTIGLVGNMAVSLVGGSMVVHTAFGVVTLASGIALAVHYFRHR